jgi:L-xylulokinase
MEKYILTVDRGSTNLKVVLFNENLEQVHVVSAPNAAPSATEAGCREYDLDYAWQQLCEVIRTDVRSFCSAEQIEAVTFSGHGNGLILLGDDKRPVMNGIYSLDDRGSEFVDRWKADGRFEKAGQFLRAQMVAGAPIPLFAWLKENQPERLIEARHFLFAKDWLRFCFTGELATDYTDASGSALLNHARQDYAADVFELLDIAEFGSLMPPLLQSSEQAGVVTGEAARETGIKQGTPVFVGAHDICACPAGIADLSEKIAISAFGSWSISVLNVVDTTGLPIGINHVVEGQFLTGVGDGNAGVALDAMLNLCFADLVSEGKRTGEGTYRQMERLVSPADKTSLFFVPHLFGSMLNPTATAGLLGLRGHTTRTDILKAVCEGILLGYLVNLDLLPHFQQVESIWLTGGGGKSDLLGQIMADIFERDVLVSEDSEMSARGAAVCAMLGLEKFNAVTDAPTPRVRKRFKPDQAMTGYYRPKAEMMKRFLLDGDSLLAGLGRP